jgi:phosphatidylglycerophosphatase A
LGIMADDILAGLFAGVLVFLINLAVTGAGS